MESVTHLLFEDPLPVCVAMLIAEVVCLAVWWFLRTRRSAMALLVPLLLAGGVVLAARLVKTDREQITDALHEIAASASADQLRTAEGWLDPDCRMPMGGQTLGAREIIELGRDALTRHRVAGVALLAVEVRITGRRATTTLTTVVTLAGFGRYALGWELSWMKRPAGWRIVEVRSARADVLRA